VELIYSIFIIHIHVACEQNLYNYQRLQSKLLYQPPLLSERHCSRDRMVVGFTTTYEISAYHHWRVVSLNPIQVRCTRYNISLSVTCDRSVISPESPVSSTNKTGCHDITEILLKMATTIHSQPWHSRWHIQKRMSLIMADKCSAQPLLLFTSASGDYVILVDLK
jgi:hypothetical protein